MPTKAERKFAIPAWAAPKFQVEVEDEECSKIANDIGSTLTSTIRIRAVELAVAGDLKELKRLQGRLVKIIQSFEAKAVNGDGRG